MEDTSASPNEIALAIEAAELRAQIRRLEAAVQYLLDTVHSIQRHPEDYDSFPRSLEEFGS